MLSGLRVGQNLVALSKSNKLLLCCLIFLGVQTIGHKPATAALTQAQIAQSSCDPTGGSPLTKNDIELRGRKLGFKLDANTMGRAFQNFVIDSVGDVENTKPLRSLAREAATLNRGTTHKFVVPDALGTIRINRRDSEGRIIRVDTYPESRIKEVKFTGRSIQLSSFEHQITGHVDVANQSAAGRASSSLGQFRPTPRLTFQTPSDAPIAPSVIDAANRVRVAVWQQVACDVPATPSPTDMIMGKTVLLNFGPYSGSAPPTTVMPYRNAGLRP